MCLGSGPRFPAIKITLAFFAILDLVSSLRWDRNGCVLTIRNLMDTSPGFSENPEVFFGGHGNREFPVLTLPACYTYCGGSVAPYQDIGPRLSTWLLPIFFLLANLQFAPIGKGRMFMILHLLGDPIDSMFSLLTKVEVWNRCFSLAEELRNTHSFAEIPLFAKHMAVVLSAMEELVGPQTRFQHHSFDAEGQSTLRNPLDLFKEMFPENCLAHPDFEELTCQTAGELVDVRTKEMRRTWLSIFFYLFSIIAAFVPGIGGEPSSAPGGRIGTAMLLSLLLPNVIMSNIVGDFTNRRECIRIMADFEEKLRSGYIRRRSSVPMEVISTADSRSTLEDSGASPPNTPQPNLVDSNTEPAIEAILEPSHPAAPLVEDATPSRYSFMPSQQPALQQEQPTSLPHISRSPTARSIPSLRTRIHTPSYWKELAWSGAIYPYRPHKHLFTGNPNYDRKARYLLILSVLPVLVAGFIACAILWHTVPIGFTCRHFVIIFACFFWLLSPLLTWAIVRRGGQKPRDQWYLVLIKDACFAVPIVTLVFASSCGLWNGCKCWSGYYMFGAAKAHVDLNPDGSYYWNNKHVYPYWVSICLLLQLFVVTGAMWFTGRRGLRVMRWSEKERLEALRLAFPREIVTEARHTSQGQGFENNTGNLMGSSAAPRGQEHGTEFEMQSLLGSRRQSGDVELR